MADVHIWLGTPPRLEKVGVWVMCSGVQADAPMRKLLTRGLGTAALKGCDQCGIHAKKGDHNSNKYIGYCSPCTVDMLDEEGVFWGECKGWANGTVVSGSNKLMQAMGKQEPFSSHFLSEWQVRGRDKGVDVETQRIQQRYDLNTKSGRSRADDKVAEMAAARGSKGQSEFEKAHLPYWWESKCNPVAVFHCTHLGISKDYPRYWLVRMGVREQPKEPLILPFAHPLLARQVWTARRKHFVCRSSPSCIIPDYMTVLNSMNMAEMQLFFEVAVPYLVHDMTAYGVPQQCCVMFLLLRFGMLCFTRVMWNTNEEYLEQLRLGAACMFAYGAIAEHFHSQTALGLSQFPFTWKLHKLQHFMSQMTDRGFATESSDMWVERMMRHKASMLLKCVHPRMPKGAQENKGGQKRSQ